MIPLTVTATMATGIAHSLPWGIALDGILAAALWQDLKPARTTPALDVDNPPDLDLPLARCTPAEGPWHWAATCSWPDPLPGHSDVHHWTSRVDHRHLEHLTPSLPKVISDRQGRWKAYRMPLITYPCRTLTWTAVGDLEAITALLSQIPAIGKKRSQGEGQVLAWNVTPALHLDEFSAGHLTPTGELGRPTPARCLDGRRVPFSGQGLAAIRPPAMHPSRICELYLPAPVMR